MLPEQLHDQRRHLLPVRHEHARAARRAVRGKADLLPEPSGRRQAAAGHRGDRGAAGDGRGRGRRPTTTRRPRTSTSPTSRRSSSCSTTARRSPATRSPTRSRASTRSPTSRTSPSTSPTRARGVPGRDRGRSPQRGADACAQPRRRAVRGISSNDAASFSGTSRSCSTARSSRARSSTSSRTRPGSTAAPGAQISGNFTLSEARTWPSSCKIGALPIKLALISQSTVSATLGQQALDQGLKAGIVGLDPGRSASCSSTTASSGVIAGARAGRLRGLLLRADQADPDHADPAGDRRADPDDRRRGRRQHRHLRADQGGGAGRALDAVGDRPGLSQGHRDDHRRERDHPDHGVHPLRARDRGRQGVRVHARRSARSSRCSPRCCSRRRCSACSGARRSCARRVPRRRAARAAGTSTSPAPPKCFFSISGVILAIGAIAFATKQLNLGIDFESGTRIQAALARGRRASTTSARRCRTPASTTPSAAKIQETENPEFGAERDPDPGARSRRIRSTHGAGRCSTSSSGSRRRQASTRSGRADLRRAGRATAR